MDKNQRIVIDIFRKYPETIKEFKSFSSVLADCIPGELAYRVALCNAYKEGIVDCFLNEGVDHRILNRFYKILENNYGMNEKYSRWAVNTFVYICGLDNDRINELFPTKTKSEKAFTRGKRSKHAKYYDGEIIYDESDRGVSIRSLKIKKDLTRSILKNEDNEDLTLVIVIPEIISGKNVYCILPGAFDLLVSTPVKIEIIVPHTVESIGFEGVKMFSVADSADHKSSLLRIRYSFRKNGECKLYNLGAYQRNLDSEEFFVREDVYSWEKHSTSIEGDFEDIHLKESKDDQYWVKPKNGLWIEDKKLKKCTSETALIKINSKVRIICEGAFTATKNARILYVPQTVKEVHTEGLDKIFEFLIIDGLNTYCYPLPAVKYVYIHENSDEAGYYLQDGRRYLKNIIRLRHALYPKLNEELLIELCEENMDEKDDFELRDLPNWNGYYR